MHRLSPDLREVSAGGYCTQFIDEETEAQQVKLSGRAQTLSPVFLSPASPKLTPRLRLSNEDQLALTERLLGSRREPEAFTFIIPFILNDTLKQNGRSRFSDEDRATVRTSY